MYFLFATVPVYKSGGRARSWANTAEEGSAGRACERVVLRETQSELARYHLVSVLRAVLRSRPVPLVPYDSEERQDLIVSKSGGTGGGDAH